MTLYKGYIRNAQQTPVDVRLATAAQLTRDTSGNVRTGILGELPTLVTARGDMAVTVGEANFVSSKSLADGAVIFGNRGFVAVPLEGASTANSRIDVVYVKHNDDTTGDADPFPIFGVVKGDAAASPIKKAIPTGAIELATILLPAGVTATNSAGVVITQTAQATSLLGSPVPVGTGGQFPSNLPDGSLAWSLTPSIAQANLYIRRLGSWVPMVNDTGFIAFPLVTDGSAGWSAKGTTGTPGFYNVNGMTFFQGRVTRNGGTARIAKIPSAFAPKVTTIFTVGDGARTMRRVQIDGDGNIDLVDSDAAIDGLTLGDIAPYRAQAF